MSFKLFTAIHEGKQAGTSVYFHEKRSEDAALWLFALLPFAGEHARKTETGLRELFDRELFSVFADGGDFEERFELALKKANEFLLESIGDKAEDVLRSGALIVGYLHENGLLISSFGQGEVFLARDRTLLEVSEGLSPVQVGEDYFLNISSGDLQNGDKLIFSTIRLQRYITERQLAGYMGDGVTEAMEAIESSLAAAEPGTVFLVNVKAVDTLPFPESSTKFSDTKGKSTNAIAAPLTQLSNVFNKFTRQQGRAADWKKWMIPTFIFGGLIVIFFTVRMLSGGTGNEISLKYADFVENVETDFSMVETRLQENKADQANLILNRVEEQAKQMLIDRVDVTNAEKILTAVTEKREVVNRIMRITNPDIMTDLLAAKQGIIARGMFFIDAELFVFDTTNLLRILLSGSNAENLGSITTNDEIALGTAFPSKNEAIFITKGGSVLEWVNGNTDTAVTADTTWKSTIDIGTFSKFLYFLDPVVGQIWKYERRDSGFTIAEAWITDATDVKNAVSFAIDGSVYVLTNTGEIIKFYRGARVNFELKDIPGGKLTGDIVFTNENLDQIFVLNKAEKKIYVLSKLETEAVYKKQIVLENTEPIVDIFVREGRLFALGEQKVYEIKL